MEHGGCTTGDAVITEAGNLKAKYVVHAVGPQYRNGNNGEAELLFNAYTKSLNLAAQVKASSIAFPSISTGIYGYPVEKAAPVALNAVTQFCKRTTSLQEITFVLFDAKTFQAYDAALSDII